MGDCGGERGWRRDNPETSLYFLTYKTQTDIFEQFGTATTIIDLAILISGSDTEGTIEGETADVVKGTMLLLLDNTKPNNPNSEDVPPATCRVVVVNFTPLTVTGQSEELPFGDSERLQSSCTYLLIAASISNTLLTIPSPPPSIFTSDAPRVRKILCQPGTIGEKMISLEGYKLEAGEYTIHFEGSPSLTLKVTFDEDQKGKPKQKSSSVSVGPGGKDTRFKFGETYKMEKITSGGQPVLLESADFSLTFPSDQTPFIFEVKKGGDGGSCQGEENSCGSLDAALDTVTKLRLKSIELNLVVSDTISKPFSISDESKMILSQGGLARRAFQKYP
ncbi:hypothetical protein BLNAU_21413 [Blattamonas nauphoetae]|uniref:Uncharacterized protein n=1 Tax=Blattamonas nauphoetae TaxID=2049346 RepID=A0ABQ9WW02_9EUKA|nr:hypothetical protein BLNAU_21413 [Blattamonas nauphoetae]